MDYSDHPTTEDRYVATAGGVVPETLETAGLETRLYYTTRWTMTFPSGRSSTHDTQILLPTRVAAEAQLAGLLTHLEAYSLDPAVIYTGEVIALAVVPAPFTGADDSAAN